MLSTVRETGNYFKNIGRYLVYVSYSGLTYGRYKILTADCGLRTADCGLRTADCGLRTTQGPRSGFSSGGANANAQA